MGFLLKLRLLLWKNFLIRRRNKFRLVVEVVYPLLLFIIIVAQRPTSTKTTTPEYHYKDKAMPSAGQLPFLHSILTRTMNERYDRDGNLITEEPVSLNLGNRAEDLAHVASAPNISISSYVSPCQKLYGAINSITHYAVPTLMIKPFIEGKILYYPDTVATRSIMKKVNATFNELTDLEVLRLFLDKEVLDIADECIERSKVEAVSSEAALEEAWALERYSELWALVYFEAGNETVQPFVQYSIRMPPNRVGAPPKSSPNGMMGNTNQVKDSFYTDLSFITFGFAYLQDMIDTAIIEIQSDGASAPGRILQQFPSPETSVDELASMMTQLMPLMMVLAWVYTFTQTVKSVVLEKEERVKEVLAVMGLGRGVQWAGWILEGLRSSAITCVLVVILLKFGNLAPNSDPSLVLVLLLSFVVAMHSFALLVACFFTRAVLAGPCAGVIYFLSYLVQQLVQTDASYEAVLGASLLSNVALAQGMLNMATAEESGFGAQWVDLNQPAGPHQPCTMAGSIGMLWLDTVLYAILTWYIEAVFPGQYGVPKHWLFFLDKAYWFGTPNSVASSAAVSGQASGHAANAHYLEAEPEDAVVGVAIDNLHKDFGKKKAVSGLSLNFYEDQINCFLGHNGAGKTTTISMLTGMYTPSSGTARLYGRDIRTDMDAIRSSMGVCPQHNVLFGSLTVEEHLLFFGRIKGIPEKVLRKEIDGMLSEMNLEDKRGARASTLSGGMKRKLSVGMAFVGGSRVVFLDEPTAGVDPFSRRGIWDLLVSFRKGRTIILTTHFMDEAELLGDRIAIMSHGRLQCCGSSVFLKEKLGSGYHLTVELEESAALPDRRVALLRAVQCVVPAAHLRTGNETKDAEVVFTLPDRHDVAAITALLEHLDAGRADLAVSSYAISDTALEEIFLKVAENEMIQQTDGTQSDVVTLEDDASASELLVEPVSGFALLRQQYTALTRKRFNYVRRDPKGLFTQLVLPAFFVMLALALASSKGNDNNIAVRMEPSMFSKPVVSFFEEAGAFSNRYVASMFEYGVGSTLNPQRNAGPVKPAAQTTRDVDYQCTNSPPIPAGSIESASLPSGELYYNLTGSNVEQWIVNTTTNCQRNRFGGVSFGAVYNQSIPGGKADNVKIWFSTEGYASVPAYQNAINNVLLRALAKGSNKEDYGILTYNWPLPEDPNADGARQPKIDTVELSVILSSAITVIFAMSFVPASFVMFLVEERVEQSKHLQLVSGLRPLVYWLQCFTWDLVSFIASEVFVILIFVAFQTPMYTSGQNLVVLILLIFLYGVSCTPLLYLLHWLFRIPSMAFLVLSTGNLFVGMVTTVTVMVMKVTNPKAVDTVESIFLALPQYCLGQGLMNMAKNYFTTQVMELSGQKGTSPLDWDLSGKYMVGMAVMAVVLAIAVFLAEQSTHWWHGFMQSSAKDSPVDAPDKEDDVLREEQRVLAGQADQGMLVLKGLTKRYNRKARPAVAGVSLGVERGQCFGLLGLNGAGKTTIFKMLTGDTLISGGDALVAGRSVRADMDSVRRLTGYCPQFDALVPLLTVREHLDLYSSLRGVPANQRPVAVRRAIQMFDLDAHHDKQAKSLSGGNKRKLSAAIALVGDPSLLYMDEPTTSMDPVARRFVWQRVRRVVASGRSVMLTSHSMEECEALCGRLTIMVNGKLTCIGSPHHLKHKYGSGYIAVVRCATARVVEARQLLLQRLPGATVVESHLQQLKLQIPPEQPLVDIFRALDEARRQGSLEDYSISQTTLEDVFLKFARSQTTETT